jgi:hypothetical protein
LAEPFRDCTVSKSIGDQEERHGHDWLTLILNLLHLGAR